MAFHSHLLRALVGSLAFVASVSLSSCADEEDLVAQVKACAPGRQVDCLCPGTALSGVQVCRDDGSGYQPCAGCPASAGAGGSSGQGGSSGKQQGSSAGSGAQGGAFSQGGSAGQEGGGSGGQPGEGQAGSSGMQGGSAGEDAGAGGSAGLQGGSAGDGGASGQQGGSVGQAGQSSGPPMTCEQVHGFVGCCVKGTLYFYAAGSLTAIDCKKNGQKCAWDESKKYYSCVNAVGPDPSGVYPQSCGGKAIGCGSCQSDAQCSWDKNGKLCDLSRHVCVECVTSFDCGYADRCNADKHCTPDCSSNADCPSSAPACDVTHNLCVGCVTDDDCKGPAAHVCDAGIHACVECLVDADCGSPDAPHCTADKYGHGHCVACTADSDCQHQPAKCVYSSTTDAGLTVSACVGICNTDANCTDPATPHCNLKKQECVACLSNTDCPSATPTCNLTLHKCQ